MGVSAPVAPGARESEETSDALNIDLSVAVPYHVGAGNRTGVLCKSK